MAIKEKKPEDYAINVRIVNLLRYLTPDGMTLKQKDFADLIGVLPARMNHVFKFQNRPDAIFLEKLAKAYPTLNCRYLLTAELPIEIDGYEKLYLDSLQRIKELEAELQVCREGEKGL